MSHGLSADYPEEYILMRAAKYLQTTPWELEKQNLKWKYWALLTETVEKEVEEVQTRRANMKT